MAQGLIAPPFPSGTGGYEAFTFFACFCALSGVGHYSSYQNPCQSSYLLKSRVLADILSSAGTRGQHERRNVGQKVTPKVRVWVATHRQLASNVRNTGWSSLVDTCNLGLSSTAGACTHIRIHSVQLNFEIGAPSCYRLR